MAVPEQPVKAPGTRAVRPKDAATLIIYRQRRGAVEVLMGQRHRKHKFLPERYVFPGGRRARSSTSSSTRVVISGSSRSAVFATGT